MTKKPTLTEQLEAETSDHATTRTQLVKAKIEAEGFCRSLEAAEVELRIYRQQCLRLRLELNFWWAKPLLPRAVKDWLAFKWNPEDGVTSAPVGDAVE